MTGEGIGIDCIGGSWRSGLILCVTSAPFEGKKMTGELGWMVKITRKYEL